MKNNTISINSNEDFKSMRKAGSLTAKILDELIYSFSHFNLNVEIFYATVKKRKIKNHFWVSLSKVMQSGMPTLMKKIVRIYQN